MKTNRKVNYQNIAILIIAVLLALSTIVNITMAFFTDSKSATTGTGALKFGLIQIRPEILELETAQTVSTDGFSFNLTATEVASDVVYKTLQLKNTTANNTQNYYLRVSFNFYNGGAVSDLASISIADNLAFWTNSTNALHTQELKNKIKNYSSTNWLLGSDGKLYFNSEVVLNNSDGSVTSQYIPLKIVFSSKLTQATLNNAYVTITLEAVQSANGGSEAWKSTAPSNWLK